MTNGIDALMARVAWLEQRLPAPAAAGGSSAPARRPPAAPAAPRRTPLFRQVLAETVPGGRVVTAGAPATGAPAPKRVTPVAGAAGMALAPLSPAQDAGENALVAQARALIGRPYQWGAGRLNDDAFDCSGFAAWVYRQAGRALPAQTDAAFAATEPTDAPRPGDLVFFRYDDPSQPGVRYPHMGLYAGDGRMIDAAANGGVQLRPLRADPIFRRLAGASREPAAAAPSAGSGAPPTAPLAAAPAREATVAELVAQAAERHDVSPALVTAVVQAESGFNPRAVSAAGAKGLMQLMDSTARQLGVTDSLDPQQNISGGVRYLRWLLDRYGGDQSLALAAYNAGPGAVDRHGGTPPYAETQAYVAKVLAYVRQAEGSSQPEGAEHGRQDR